MALFKEEPIVAFDLSEIKRGDLIWAKHKSWDEGRGGFVTAITSEKLIAQYFPDIGNVTNHFYILASEYEEWEIRWSADLTEVKQYPEEKSEESEVEDEL